MARRLLLPSQSACRLMRHIEISNDLSDENWEITNCNHISSEKLNKIYLRARNNRKLDRKEKAESSTRGRPMSVSGRWRHIYHVITCAAEMRFVFKGSAAGDIINHSTEACLHIFHHQHLSSTRKRFSNLCCFCLPSHFSRAEMKIRPGVFHYSGVVFPNYAKVFNGTFLSGEGSRTKRDRNLKHKNNKSKPLAAGAESGFSFCETVDDEGFSCVLFSVKFNSKLSRKHLAKFIAEVGLS